jgi:hypothetical protein
MHMKGNQDNKGANQSTDTITTVEELDSFDQKIEDMLKKWDTYEGYKKEWEKNADLRQFTWPQILNAWNNHHIECQKPFPYGRLELDPKRMSFENAKFLFDIKRGLLLTTTVLGTIGCYILTSRISNNTLHKCPIILLGVGISYKLATWEMPPHTHVPYSLTEIVQMDMKKNPNLYNNGEKANEGTKHR